MVTHTRSADSHPAAVQRKERLRRGLSWICLLLLALVLVLSDRMMFRAPLEPPETDMRAASAQEIMNGVAYRRHSTVAGDYYAYRVHWPMVGLTALCMLAWTLTWQRPRKGGVWVGLCGALIGLSLLELTAIESVPLSGYFLPDAACIWRLKPDQHTGDWHNTNALGFRPTPTHVGEPRLLLLGDSTTYGDKIDNDSETYAWRLSTQLNVDVFNRAVPGYTSWQGLTMLRREIDRIHPAVVVAAFMANDWTPGDAPDRTLSASPLVVHLRALMLHSKLYLYLSQVVARSRAADRDEGAVHAMSAQAARVPPEDYRSNLTAMAALCHAHGIPLVVVALPMSARMKTVSAPYRQIVDDMAKCEGVRSVDLFEKCATAPDRENWFSAADPLHPDALGHAWIARQLKPVLSSLVRR